MIPTIAVTSGEPAGIGPDLCVLLANASFAANLVMLGDRDLLAARATMRGIDIVLSRYAPIWAGWRTPVLLSLTGADPQSAAELAALLEGVEGLAGIEFDCADYISTVAIGAVVKAVRVATFLPLLVKLPAQAADIAALAQSAAESGADALVISAPPRGQWQDQTGHPIGGWLCGPAQHPAALARVSQVVEAIDIPVIGSGGIVDAAGVDRMLAAGARAVQIGSALLADPGLAMRLAAAYQSS